MGQNKYGAREVIISVTNKQRMFADLYLQTGNATEAAKKAGYSEKSARTTGFRMLKNADVKAFIAHRLEVDEVGRIADLDEVLRFLSDVMRGVIKDQFGLDASIADRLAAAKELIKRYAVADVRQQTTLEKLDSLLFEFRAALDEDNELDDEA